MSGDTSEGKNGATQMWMVSLAISVFCCALFFAFLSMYVSDVSKTLASIDERLAGIEQKVNAAGLVPPPAPAVNIPTQLPPAAIQPIAPPAPLPEVEVPGTEPAPAAVEGAAPSGTPPVSVDQPQAVPAAPSVAEPPATHTEGH